MGKDELRVGIVGSRRRKDSQSVYDLVKRLPGSGTVVSGGCWGPDSWALDWAKKRGLPCEEFLPDMPPHGSSRWELLRLTTLGTGSLPRALIYFTPSSLAIGRAVRRILLGTPRTSVWR